MTSLAASVMRRLPVGIRKVRVWRDKAYTALGGGGWAEDDALDAKWPSDLRYARHRNGMIMALDLTDWCQRRSYFTGRFYQEDLEDLLSAILRPGDVFVDVGSNIGMIALHAASIVDNVWAFEPNPDVYARLIQHLELNDLDTSLALNMGLGEEDATLTLNLYGRNTGRASLVKRSEEAGRRFDVAVKRGDDVLPPFDKPAVFKIDVEGFETSVLKGLSKHLGGDVAVAIEVSPAWLQAAGSSTDELFSVLGSHGLKPYRFALNEGRFTRSLEVTPIDGPQAEEQYDCLFMRPQSVFAERLKARR